MPMELIKCISQVETQQKNLWQRSADELENALTKLRLILPLDELKASGVEVWKIECAESEDLETAETCGYGLYEKKHSWIETLNRYSIGPYQMRPSIALRMEPLASRIYKRPLRSPFEIIAHLLSGEKAVESVSAYLLYLKGKVEKYYGIQSSLPMGVWATLYNEGQIEYRILKHQQKILTRMNRFGRKVDHCLQSKSSLPRQNLSPSSRGHP